MLSSLYPSKPLISIAQVYSGYAFRSEDLLINSDIPVIKIANIQNRKVQPYCSTYLPESLYNRKLQKYLLVPGDILVAMTGAGSVGRIGKMWRVDKKYLVNQRVGIIRVQPALADPEYVYQAISNDNSERILYNLALGAGQPNLSPTNIGNLELPLPSLPTQRRIAAVLSAYDDLIENNARRIAILEEMARNLYREWFVYFRFPGHEDVEIVERDGVRVPSGWEQVTVEQIIQRVPVGKKYDAKTVSPVGNVPVLDQGKSGIIGYHNDSPGVVASMEEPIIVFANHTCYQRLVQFPFSGIQNVLPFKSNESYQRDIYWLHWATNGLVVFNDYKGHVTVQGVAMAL